MRDLFKFALGAAATAAIYTHLTASVIQNTPDSYNQDMSRFTGGWTLPGWRFFAPNPGIQNVHLLVRARTEDAASPSLWEDATPHVPHGWRQVAWNPASRGPKALFDAMQQLTIMNINKAELAWVTSSTAFQLVVSAARRATGDDTAAAQFMLMNVVPSAAPEHRMRPVFVSPWFDTRPERSGT